MFKRGHILISIWRQSKRRSESNVCMQRWCLPPIKWDLNVGPTNCQSRYKRQSFLSGLQKYLNSTWEGGRQRMRKAFSNLIFAAIELWFIFQFWILARHWNTWSWNVLTAFKNQTQRAQSACFCQKTTRCFFLSKKKVQLDKFDQL